MSLRSLVSLAVAFTFAFGAAFWTYSAGFGLIATFLTYSLGGSFALVAVSAMAYVQFGDATDDDVTALEDGSLQLA